MAEIIRNRTIRPSSRLEKSKSYKIDTKKVSSNDILIVNINHESNSFLRTYIFNGSDIAKKNSISFRVKDFGISIDISWSGANPINSPENLIKNISERKPTKTNSTAKNDNDLGQTYLKTSFEPISNSETTILILGTAPGNKSIESGKYYNNSQNRFWKIISTLTNNDLPTSYDEKKQLLLNERIGIWDVGQKVIRKGSLDNSIKSVKPNDIDNFIKEHINLKIIAFNGQKAEKLYDEFFDRKNNLTYISLPSTSSANTRFSFDELYQEWKSIFDNS